MYKILVYGRGFSPDPHHPFRDFENPLGQHTVPSCLRSGLRSALPEGIFKIPEREMGIWGKSTTINQNFVHIFFLILVTSKHFSIYPITLYLYIDEHTLQKNIQTSVFSRGLYYQVDGNQDTFFEIRFVSYFIYSAFLSVTLWENDTPVIKSVLKGHFCPGL